MSDYTPTTEEMRNGNPTIWRDNLLIHLDPADFDRWLASVKADAFDEGQVAEVRRYITKTVKNPYRGEKA